MSLFRTLLLTLLVSALVGGLGVWVGTKFIDRSAHRSPGLHELVHDRLDLSAPQRSQIEGLEAQHAVRREALESEMRAANAELAAAMLAKHAYTPDVQAAVDRLHHAMGELQKETIEHTLAMRTVLTPEQARTFDELIARSLTEAAR